MSKKTNDIKKEREEISLRVYGNGIGEEHVNKTDTWQTNQNCILMVVRESISENGVFPQVTTIAKLTGLSRVTVYKHLKTIDSLEYRQKEKAELKLLANDLLLKLYNNASDAYQTNESLKSAKIFLDYVSKIDKAPQNQFVQLNQIQINQTTIQALPQETKQEIERLILESSEFTKPLQISNKKQND